MQLRVEGLQEAQRPEADASGGDRADLHRFQANRSGARHAIGDVPAALRWVSFFDPARRAPPP
jgi:hypothetical protein